MRGACSIFERIQFFKSQLEQFQTRTIILICNVVPVLECLSLGLGVLFVAASWAIRQSAGQLPEQAASSYLYNFKADGRTAFSEIKDASL